MVLLNLGVDLAFQFLGDNWVITDVVLCFQFPMGMSRAKSLIRVGL